MKLFPPLHLGLLNGWIPLTVFFLMFGFILLVFPKKDVARLYDRTGWSIAEQAVSHVIKIVALVYFGLFTWSSLLIGSLIFIVGVILYLSGVVLFFVALINFRHAPDGRPATNGLYRVSRNPQWVGLMLVMLGISMAIGSWIALFLFLLTAILSHVRILAEEKSCVTLFGDSYENYLEETARYFLFF
jgi:protein-S-isoprenylcysteine O-methyltransferase Ste14